MTQVITLVVVRDVFSPGWGPYNAPWPIIWKTQRKNTSRAQLNLPSHSFRTPKNGIRFFG